MVEQSSGSLLILSSHLPLGVLEIRKTLGHDKSEAGDGGTGVPRQPCDTADPTGRLDSPNANPPIPPGRKRARLSAALDGAGHVLCRVAVAKAALLLDHLRSYVFVKVAAPDASKS